MLHGRRRRLLTKLQHTRMERYWNATTWLSRGIRPNGSGAFLHCHSHSYIIYAHLALGKIVNTCADLYRSRDWTSDTL